MSEQLSSWSSSTGLRRALSAAGDGLRQLRSRMSAPPTLPMSTNNNKVLFYTGLVVVALSIISALTTYVVLTGLTPIQPTHAVVVSVLAVNALLVFAMLAVIGWQVVMLRAARKQQLAGSRLHVRIATLFSLIAVLPALLLAVFATASLNRALDNLFSRGTERIINNSVDVAKAYVTEHGQVIRSDVVAMAADMGDDIGLLITSRKTYESELFAQATLRNLGMAHVINGKGEILASAPMPRPLPYIAPAPRLLAEAALNEVVIVPPEKSNQVGAMTRIGKTGDRYLYVARTVNAKVMEHLTRTVQRALEYRQLVERRTGTQLAFGLMHLAVTLTLLLAAIWTGMWFASNLVAPIRRLIDAAGQLSAGNFDHRLPLKRGDGDLSKLSNTFNSMAAELKKQRDELVNTNNELTERRRFIEAVLSGVSAGVIGIDAQGVVDLANPSALKLLNVEAAEIVGRRLAEVLPAFQDAYATFQQEGRLDDKRGAAPVHVDLTVRGAERNFALRVTRELASSREFGHVITFDDITELVTAQRSSAWSDVARRIAHEIKNPLTPIQLSAERLKRKYSSVITADREVFDRCTDTIIRQVGDLGRMVDEFSSFAKLPKATMEPNDIGEIIKEVMFLFSNGSPSIDFVVSVPDQQVILSCDRRLVTQAVTNLVKNATEGIVAVKEQPSASADFKGRIDAELVDNGSEVTISIIDNGVGLPKKDRNRLVEPYNTTRAKGTGIGLAVVNKVTEQHNGRLSLEDAPVTDWRPTGACIRLTLPRVGAVAVPDGSRQAGKPGARPEVAAI